MPGLKLRGGVGSCSAIRRSLLMMHINQTPTYTKQKPIILCMMDDSLNCRMLVREEASKMLKNTKI